MNYLFCSVGRRCELVKDFKRSMDPQDRIIATDASNVAPALYFADRYYVVPRIDAPDYMKTILAICKKENIRAVTTFIDPEIEVLAAHRAEFEALGVEVLAPYRETAAYCFDKYRMYRCLVEHGIPTVPTYADLDSFCGDCAAGKISFPVFVKPRTGSGSVGARKIASMEQLRSAMEEDPSLIIQRFMEGEDLDADVYIDTISHQVVSAFAKRKLETRIGGASKTISFKDDALFDLICRIVSCFRFNGPVDMDFFRVDGQYYLSEINPRFGGAYLHAYGAGVDFVKLIRNNLNGIENKPCFGDYEEDVVMMMYDSVVIRRSSELAEGFAE